MGGDFCMGAESCRWISMQNVAPLYPEYAISQTMKSPRIIRNELQWQAKQDFTLNFEENFQWDSCNVGVFCDKWIAIPETKLGFLSGL